MFLSGMSLSSQRLLARIGRWPRRIAALVCLLFAAASALVPDTRATSSPQNTGVGSALRAGEVAVPVPISAGGIADVRPGDRVGVLAAPVEGGTGRAVLILDKLRVLTVNRAGPGFAADTSTVVVVATDRAGALQVARYNGRPLIVIADELP